MAHLHYALDLCIEAFIVNDGAVLLRMHDKFNKWTGPGGHIDPNEDPNEAVKREAMEEAGLEITLIDPTNFQKEDAGDNWELVPPMFLNRHHINGHHDHSCLVFAATCTTREINPRAEEKDVDFVWVTAIELEDMHANDPKLLTDRYQYAKKALELAG
jgi:8-oxo-dGTP pyrophosphatase MutT (NUDIX family)